MEFKDHSFRLQCLFFVLLLLCFFFVENSSGSSRIKDVARLEGLEEEKLVGYGLVVGLNGSGDGRRATFTIQSLANMLERFGVTVDPDELRVENVAAVMVTANVGPFCRPGAKIDVTVSSLGDATSLGGGTLLFTPLRGGDGTVYAVAQGPIATGGFSVDAGAGNVVRQNLTNVGIVIGGGVVKKAPPHRRSLSDSLNLCLLDPDFRTAQSLVEAVNRSFGPGVARGLDAGNVLVTIPPDEREDPVGFVAALETLSVQVDVPARVVINEKTGTVVVGGGVEVGEAAIAHGNLKVEIRTNYEVSQAEGFATGSTVVVPEVKTMVQDREAGIFAFKESTTVGNIAEALNEIGVSPRDIIAIFQALKRAGALRAELIIM